MNAKEYFNRSEYNERFTRVMNDDMIDRLYNDIDRFVDKSIKSKLDLEKRRAAISAMQGLLASGMEDSGDIVLLSLEMSNVMIDAINANENKQQ